jgi:polysaccharide biosynthesis transport protein
MKEYSSQPLGSEKNGDFVSPSLQIQTPPWLESEGEDWSLRDFLGILRRRSLVITGVATVVMVTFAYSTLKQKPVYESSFRLLVEPLNNETVLQDITSGQNSNSTESGLDYESQIQVLKSPELVTSIVRSLQTSYPNLSYDSLVNSLTITRLGETKIIEVRYRSNNPREVKVILNQLAKAYSKYSLEKRQTSVRQGLQFVEKQLISMHKRVDQLQKDLQIFRQKYDFTDPGTQTEQIANQVNLLSQQRLAVNQQLATARNKFSSLKGQEGELAALSDASAYQQLLTQVRQLDTQIAAELTRFHEDSPVIQSLKEKREQLLPLLEKEAQRILNVKQAQVGTEVQTLEVQSQKLAEAEQKLEKQRKQLPVLTRQYTELQRKLQVATESLNRFLTTRETLQIQVAQTELPWQLIQAPVQPETPVAPDIKRGLISGAVISLLLGIGTAMLLEKLDDTYQSVEALKKKIKQPLLGTIPFEKSLQHSSSRIFNARIPRRMVLDSLSKHIPGLATVTEQDSTSNYSAKFLEALRVLYTNIQLLNSDRPIRSLVISSTMSGDGKSTVAFQIAQIFAAMGHRVLLVDADLRQPMIHTLSNLNNQWGLSNLISTNLPITEALRRSPFMSQLSILTAGPIPPDPIKLLSSGKMKRLMEDFHNTFDLVIYDTPSLVGLADASLLAPNTDGILLVTRIGKTHCSALKRALDNLTVSRMNVLGIIANGSRNNFDNY